MSATSVVSDTRTLNTKKYLTGKTLLCLLTLPVLCVLAGLLTAPSALAKEGNDSQAYSIAAGSLGDVLAEFAALAGAPLSFDPQQLAGRQSPGLTGRYGTLKGFSTLLQDSGYAVQEHDNGSYRLVAADETTAAVSSVDIGGKSKYSSDLPKEYAGGQVGSGGRVGLLGNQDIFDTPFSVTNYTSELIENQQARTVGDVIRNDASARLTSSGQSYFENITIRGFYVGNFNSTLYDGLPNLTSYRSTVQTLDRVEVFKGPNALLNGVSGRVGGVINLVPKRPDRYRPEQTHRRLRLSITPRHSRRPQPPLRFKKTVRRPAQCHLS